VKDLGTDVVDGNPDAVRNGDLGHVMAVFGGMIGQCARHASTPPA
jgi:hypothetical protein